MSEKTKLVVVGGGPGGYAAAFLGADLGMDVTLIDLEKNPGGVCLYRGCIPSKALLHNAKLIYEAREAAHWGLDFGEPKIDLDKVRGFKNSVVQKLTGGTGQLAKARKIKYLQGRAKFIDGKTLDVQLEAGGSETVSFDKAIIATGSRPAVIKAFDIGSKRIMDSTAALEMESIPATLLIVGGGYIGLELGTVYAAMGSKVTVVEAMAGLLPGAGPRPRGIPAQEPGNEVRQDPALDEGSLDGRSRGRRQSHGATRRRRGDERNLRESTCRGRTNAEHPRHRA
jgi:dihydrolipoamide dehydrogenase